MAFSSDGQLIATGSHDRTTKVWQASSGQELFPLKQSGLIGAVAFSPDGQRVVTGSDDTAKLWDASNGSELLTLRGHRGSVTSVAFSPDGQGIITGSLDQTLRVWEAAAGQEVAAWQEEEKAAAERLKVLRREAATASEHERALRAQDPGAIKQWLVLAPIPLVGHDGVSAVRQEQLPQEANLRPRAGERVRVGTSELVWTPSRQADYILDFNDFLGEMTEWSVAYAVCYILSDSDQNGLSIKVGSDDESRIYLNGTIIYRCEEGRQFAPDVDLVRGLSLRSGTNTLVFKVVNETAGWFGSIQFTDSAGRPVKGIQVTLTPR